MIDVARSTTRALSVLSANDFLGRPLHREELSPPYAISMPVLPGDWRGAWDRTVLADRRVASVWDGVQLRGKWFQTHFAPARERVDDTGRCIHMPDRACTSV